MTLSLKINLIINIKYNKTFLNKYKKYFFHNEPDKLLLIIKANPIKFREFDGIYQKLNVIIRLLDR